MKKVSLFILLVIVASTLLMAAIPTKMVRLTIINKSGYEVMMKLTGSDLTGAFYYLVVPEGSRDAPSIKVFTIMSDVYDRETWQCGGLKSRGVLIVDGNLRLTFTPCGEAPCGLGYYIGRPWFKRCPGVAFGGIQWHLKLYPKAVGEPRMEKVTYWKYFLARDMALFGFNYRGVDFWRVWQWWRAAYGWNTWITSCGLLWWRTGTFRTPVGCQWRYQY